MIIYAKHKVQISYYTKYNLKINSKNYFCNKIEFLYFIEIVNDKFNYIPVSLNGENVFQCSEVKLGVVHVVQIIDKVNIRAIVDGVTCVHG